MSEVGCWEDTGWQWRLNWRRERFEWEVNLEEDLLTQINRGDMNMDSKDQIVWVGDITGVFSVKSAYGCLANQSNDLTNEVFSSLW